MPFVARFAQPGTGKIAPGNELADTIGCAPFLIKVVLCKLYLNKFKGESL